MDTKSKSLEDSILRIRQLLAARGKYVIPLTYAGMAAVVIVATVIASLALFYSREDKYRVNGVVDYATLIRDAVLAVALVLAGAYTLGYLNFYYLHLF